MIILILESNFFENKYKMLKFRNIMVERAAVEAFLFSAMIFLALLTIENPEADLTLEEDFSEEDISWLMVHNAKGFDLQIDEQMGNYCDEDESFGLEYLLWKILIIFQHGFQIDPPGSPKNCQLNI